MNSTGTNTNLGEYYRNFFDGLEFDLVLLVMRKRGFLKCKKKDLDKIDVITIPFTKKKMYRPKPKK